MLVQITINQWVNLDKVSFLKLDTKAQEMLIGLPDDVYYYRFDQLVYDYEAWKNFIEGRSIKLSGKGCLHA